MVDAQGRLPFDGEMTPMQTIASRPLRFPWLFGARIDFLFFYASIVLGCLLLAIEQSVGKGSALLIVVLLNALGAGPVHQGATWLAYYDRDNRVEFASTLKNRLVFIVAPPVVFFATIATMLVFPLLAILIFVAWSVQHIIAQNIGILLLYHNHDGNEAVVEKSLETKTLWLAGFFFGSIFAYRALFESAYQEIIAGGTQLHISGFLNATLWLSRLLPLVAVVGILAIWSIAVYFYRLDRQLASGRYLNVPALIFWLVSLAAISPLAFLGKSFEEGILIPSTMHWFQYIALNYVLIKNKSTGHAHRRRCNPMHAFIGLGIAAIVIVMGTSLLVVSSHTPQLKQLLIGVVMGFGGVHYFLDAFLWRFRDPQRQKAVLTYLVASKVVG